METVRFTRMADGTADDYALLDRYEEQYMTGLPNRLMESLEKLRASFAGYQVSRYEHSLQSATRALRDGRDEEYVVAALLHDIGDELAPWTHGEMVAAILKPYVRPEVCWVVKHHGLFQLYYRAHHSGGDRNARDRYIDQPWYAAGAAFCQPCRHSCLGPASRAPPSARVRPMVARRSFAVRCPDLREEG